MRIKNKPIDYYRGLSNKIAIGGAMYVLNSIHLGPRGKSSEELKTFFETKIVEHFMRTGKMGENPKDSRDNRETITTFICRHQL